MILRIARKEATEMLRDGRFRWASALVAVLLLASLATGWAHRTAAEAERTAAQAADREVWTGQGEKNQHSAAHFGLYAFKPSTALSAADPGVLPYTGTAVFMEAHSVKDAAYRPAEDATAVQRLGRLTAATTLQLLVPLLILLLTFSTFAGEREAGTLRQLLSLGVSRGTLAAGKALGVAIPVALVVVPAALVGVAALAISEGAASLPRAALWAGAYVLYFGVVLALALAVSAQARSSRVALVTLLGFWLVTGFVVPRLAADVASGLHPAPTIDAYNAALRDDFDALRAADAADPHAAETPRSAGEGLLRAEERGTEVYRRRTADLVEVHRAQNRTVQAMSLLSPALAVQVLSMGLAGTDEAHHRHFADAAEAYRYEYVQTLNQDMVDQDADWDYLADAALWERVTPFDYQAPDVAWAVRPYGLAAASLALWAFGLLVLLPFTLRRMPVA